LKSIKERVYLLYGLLHSLKSPKILLSSLSAYRDKNIYESRESIKLASEWLLMMQNSDGGFSRKYSFITARDKSYIETTGYIIPTLIDVSSYLNDESYRDSALNAGEFLLRVQNSDGSFCEIDESKPLVFDTGQCLIGLNRLYLLTEEKRYLDASSRAVRWLLNVLEEDKWVEFAYNKQPHTYYSRVASAIYKYAEIVDDSSIKKRALKQIEWVMKNQNENGFFNYSSFLDTTEPYLHTLVYILEGLLDIYDATQEREILDVILKNSEHFKELSLQNKTQLCSQYNKNFECINSEVCVTGLAQWAGVSMRLYEITQDSSYKRSTQKTLNYLKTKQIKSSMMRGGFSASIPFYGKYGSFDFVNWTNKFFIDSLLKSENFKGDKV